MTEPVPPVVRLSADLARNLGARPGGDPAAELAEHVRRFWEPRLRRELLELVGAGDPRLDPLVVRAAALLAADAGRAAAPAVERG